MIELVKESSSIQAINNEFNRLNERIDELELENIYLLDRVLAGGDNGVELFGHRIDGSPIVVMDGELFTCELVDTDTDTDE